MFRIVKTNIWQVNIFVYTGTIFPALCMTLEYPEDLERLFE
jgi:hypothetical protein